MHKQDLVETTGNKEPWEDVQLAEGTYDGQGPQTCWLAGGTEVEEGVMSLPIVFGPSENMQFLGLALS